MLKGFGFDLRALEVFITTAQVGSMTSAANRLGITQSSVSQTLTTLENNLDVSLLDRSVRPVQLTVAGRYFYDHSSQLLSQAQHTHKIISKGKFQKLHQLRVSMVDSLATSLGKPLIDAIKHHAESWTITTGRSHMHAQALLSRNVDIIISDDALEDNEHLSRHPILREPFVVVAPSTVEKRLHSLPALLTELDFIRYTSDSLIGTTMERYLRRYDFETPVCMKLDNTFAVLSSVAAGLGWAITTPLCLYQSGLLHNHKIICLPLPPPQPLHRRLTLVARQNELGTLPKVLARDCSQIIEQQFIPQILKPLPWLKSNLSIGS